MPEILITEQDNTSNEVTEYDYVVFVVGNLGVGRTSTKTYGGKITLFSDIETFKYEIGKEPTTYAKSDETEYVNGSYIYDPGYIYASFLLEKGYKVYYSIPSGTLTTWTQMVNAVNNVNTYKDLTDKLKYRFRFLTTGGYVKAPISNYTNVSTLTGYTETSNKFTCFYEVANVTSATYEASTYYYDNDGTFTLDASATFNPDRTYYNQISYAANTFYYLSDGVYTLDTSVTATAYRIYYYNVTTIPTAITTLQNIANTRGDCLVLIDHNKDLIEASDITSSATLVSNKRSTMCSPWFKYNFTFVNGVTTTTLNDFAMPASLTYLEAFMSSVKTNPTYYAAAGRLRGVVSGTPVVEYGEIMSNKLTNPNGNDTGVSVNPITNVYPYGMLIWGNRTLYNNLPENNGLIASSFLNIRQLCIDIYNALYTNANRYMFEQNTDRLWFNFKSDIEKVLNEMKTNDGIRGFKIVKENTSARATIKAKVTVVPVEGIEKFNLVVELADTLSVELSE